MPSPVKPSDFLATVPEVNSKTCRKLSLSLVKLPQLVYTFFKWALNPDGTLSDAFKAELGVPTGGGVVTTQIGTPTGVVATDGTYNDKVTISWSPVSDAASYEVFRGASDDFTTAISIGAPTATTYDDTTVAVGTTYFYWVKAKGASGTASNASVADTGFAAAAGAGGGGALLLQRYTTSGQYVVPTGVTSLWAKLFGPGGGGGSGRAPFLPIPPSGITNYGGGGGGSGEFIHVGGIPVTAGEILYFTIATIGGTGSQGTSSGGTGLETQLKRANGSIIARAMGGGGGTFGGLGPSTGGVGGTGGLASEGTLLTATPGNDGATGSSAAYPTPAAGGAGGAAQTGSNNKGGNGGNGYLSFGANGGGGQIEFYK